MGSGGHQRGNRRAENVNRAVDRARKPRPRNPGPVQTTVGGEHGTGFPTFSTGYDCDPAPYLGRYLQGLQK